MTSHDAADNVWQAPGVGFVSLRGGEAAAAVPLVGHGQGRNAPPLCNSTWAVSDINNTLHHPPKNFSHPLKHPSTPPKCTPYPTHIAYVEMKR